MIRNMSVASLRDGDGLDRSQSWVSRTTRTISGVGRKATAELDELRGDRQVASRLESLLPWIHYMPSREHRSRCLHRALQVLLTSLCRHSHLHCSRELSPIPHNQTHQKLTRHYLARQDPRHPRTAYRCSGLAIYCGN